MKKLAISLAAFAVVAGSGIAVADLTVKDGAGATKTMFDYICFSTKQCSAAVPITSAGVEISPATAAQMTSLISAVNGPIPAGTATIGAVGQLPYPINAVPYTNSATGTTTGAVATLAGAASVTTYICGFSVRANATAAATVNVVVSGTISGSLNFTQWVAPAASGLGISEMIFSPCIPASAANTSVVVTGGAPGAGGVNSATAWGYKL